MVLTELLHVLFFDDIEVAVQAFSECRAAFFPHDPEGYVAATDTFLMGAIKDKAGFCQRIEHYHVHGKPVWQKQEVVGCDLITSADLGTALSYNTIANGKSRLEMYESARARWAVHMDDYAAAVNHRDGLDILELATGAGMGTGAVVTGMGQNSRLISTDIDFQCIKNADAIAASLGMSDRVCGLTANFWSLPFEDSMFDTVCSHYGIDESGEIGKTLGEIARVLRSGGRFVCTVRQNPYDRQDRYMALFGITEAECNPLLRKARLYSGVDDLAKTAGSMGLTLTDKRVIAPEDSHARVICVFEKEAKH